MSPKITTFETMMTTEEIFLVLLRAGLWGKAEDTGDQEVDWKAIREAAHQLAVTGFIADGIAVQKKAYPGFKTVLEDQKLFIKDVFNIEGTNGKLDQLLASIATLLDSEGLTPVILKGQGLARDYPAPSHRVAGDIDILLDGDDYRKAADILSKKATKLCHEYPRIRHFGMFFGKLEVELHGTINSRMGRRFNGTLEEMQKELFQTKDFRTFDCRGTSVRIPSVEFDATFIFAHIIQHLYDFGLTLKQICDWAMLLHRHRDEIDRDLLKTRLERMDILKEWQVLGCILTDKLGLPAEELPFHDPTCSSKADKLWKAINEYSSKETSIKGASYLHGKYLNTRNRLSWIAQNVTISPMNTLRAFLGMIAGGVDSVIHGR